MLYIFVNLNVECQKDSDTGDGCRNMYINAKESTDVNITCRDDACTDNATIYCGTGDCYVICDYGYDDICSDVYIDCNTANCSIICGSIYEDHCGEGMIVDGRNAASVECYGGCDSVTILTDGPTKHPTNGPTANPIELKVKSFWKTNEAKIILVICLLLVVILGALCGFCIWKRRKVKGGMKVSMEYAVLNG